MIIRNFLFKIAYVATCTMFVVLPLITQANFTDPIPLSGYAWSSNIGWISFNCDQTLVGGSNTCGTSDYGVEIRANASNMVQGYAWSSNIGWIKFGGLDGFPGSGGNARLDIGTNEFTGWARACAGTANGDCSTNADHTDGWDGWISLSCQNNGDYCVASDHQVFARQVSATRGEVRNYAWGSDVVGWLRFNASNQSVTYPVPACSLPARQCNADLSGIIETNEWCVETETFCTTGQICNTATVTCAAPASMTGSVTIEPTLVRQGDTVQISWDTQNTTSCTVEQRNLGGVVLDSWSGGVSENSIESGPVDAASNFVLECFDLSGVTEDEVASQSVRVIPVIIET